ncbi:MAG: YihY/virulence factor BrkB family protein [Planctomycetota bacterium]
MFQLIKLAVQRRFEALFELDERAWHWSTRRVRDAGKLLYLLGRKFSHDLALERASALTFATTVGLIPLVVLLFMIFRSNLELFDAQLNALKAWMQSLGKSDEVRSEIGAAFEQIKQSLATPIAAGRAVTPLAVLGLVISVTALFRSAQRSFSVIWNVQSVGGFFKKLATFWLLLTALPLILGVSVALKSQVVDDLQIAAIQNTLLPLVLTFFGFTLVYRFLPDAAVSINAASAGAICAAIVWLLGAWLFGQYVQNWANQSLYGALGVVPLFLLWAYFSWLIAFVGCELSYCIQNFSTLEREIRTRSEGQRITRPVLAVLLLERVYFGFSGRTATAPDSAAIARDCGVPLQMVEEVLSRLSAAQLVVVTAGGALLPTRAPERCGIAEVFGLFPAGTGFRLPGIDLANSAAGRLIASLEAETAERLGRLTFRDLNTPTVDAASAAVD